jgi:hypothetical protein
MRAGRRRGILIAMSDDGPIVRVWSGVVRTEDAAAYTAYVQETGIAGYRGTPGNLDAWLLTRDLGDGRTEITTVSRWISRAAIAGFAGDDIERATFYPDDDRFLVDRDLTVRHYRQVGDGAGA